MEVLTLLITSMMQLDMAPMFLGAGLYVFCLLLAGKMGLQRRVRETQPFGKDLSVFEDNDIEELSSQSQPEPDAEPEAQPATKEDHQCRQISTIVATGLILTAVIIRAVYVSGADGNSVNNFADVVATGNLALADPQEAAADLLEEASHTEVQFDSLQHANDVGEEPVNAIAVAGSVSEDQNCFSGVPALNVKLTRLTVESNHQTNYIKSAYVGTISVGTPGLPITVIFDTGSGHLILPSMYCKSEACRVHTRYRRSSSSTGRDINFNGSTVVPGMPRDSITVEFGTGEAQGVIVEDVICFDQSTNASVTRDLWAANSGSKHATEQPGCFYMHFMAATDLSSDPFIDFGFDGVMGLSLVGLSETPEHNFLNVFSEVLDSSHSCASQSFGVFLASNPREESDIAFGGWNREHLAEQLSWASVHDPELGHWILKVKGLRVDNEYLDYCDDGTCKAAVDTGTALLSVPPTAFRQLFGMLRHEPGLSGHCRGAGPTLHFEFEDFTVSLGPREYSSVRRIRHPLRKANQFPRSNVSRRITRNDLRCFPLLMTLDLEAPLGPKLFILGEPVLRKYYTVYDAQQKRVGFGRAVHTDMPTREELLLSVPEIDSHYNPANGQRRATPTLFDIFRWRTLLKRPQRLSPTRTTPIL